MHYQFSEGYTNIGQIAPFENPRRFLTKLALCAPTYVHLEYNTSQGLHGLYAESYD
jgi:hypothetical protein